jgi:hypothetical protein
MSLSALLIMKTKSSTLSVLAVVVAAMSALAGEPSKPYTGSSEFEKLKSLAGTWQGSTDMGKGPMQITAQYRVTSGGSAVEERLFADTPMEMVTIYHEQNGKPALTHYCTLCNRPAMTMVKADEKTLAFNLSKDADIDVAKDKHMHSVAFTFDGADHYTQEWTLYEDGKAQPAHAMKFERVRK